MIGTKAYFFPGLGADASLAPYHCIPGLEIEWVKWPSVIRPSWDHFLADLLRENKIEEGAIFLGISFGGLVAVRMAERKRPAAIILIGSLVSTRAISPLLRPVRFLVRAVPAFLFNSNWVPAWVVAYFFGIRKDDHLAHFFRMAKGYTSSQAKGLVRLALSAPRTGNFAPTYAIHGGKDRILPARYREPGFLVKDGGHLLSMTHAEEVNGAISDWLGEVAAMVLIVGSSVLASLEPGPRIDLGGTWAPLLGAAPLRNPYLRFSATSNLQNYATDSVLPPNKYRELGLGIGFKY
jgi:pimeloyl-ACP methyl ester carboxylesterase